MCKSLRIKKGKGHNGFNSDGSINDDNRAEIDGGFCKYMPYLRKGRLHLTSTDSNIDFQETEVSSHTSNGPEIILIILWTNSDMLKNTAGLKITLIDSLLCPKIPGNTDSAAPTLPLQNHFTITIM